MLQNVAVCCSVLQRVSTVIRAQTCQLKRSDLTNIQSNLCVSRLLLRIAMCCSVLQQCVAVHRSVSIRAPECVEGTGRVRRGHWCVCVTVCCSMMQCVAVRCSSVLRCVALRCSALQQCVAVRCSV